MVGHSRTVRYGLSLIGLVAYIGLSATSANAIALGSYTFNDAQFGDSLVESDGGTFSASNWLNTTNANPGNPDYLTGANFETGIANINLGPTYTIGYNTPIANGAGADFGIVVARFSTDDISLEVSIDGITFLPGITVLAGTAIYSGEGRTYYYGGGGPYGASLFVHEIDLSVFGLGLGDTISAVRIGVGPNSNQLDLIRVAGFGETAVPEPAAIGLFGLGLLGLAGMRRRKAG
jgi:hypothetical protein